MNILKISAFKSNPRSLLSVRKGNFSSLPSRTNFVKQTPKFNQFLVNNNNHWQFHFTQTRYFSKSFSLFSTNDTDTQNPSQNDSAEPQKDPQNEAQPQKEPEKEVDNRDQRIEELNKRVAELRNNIKLGMAEVENTRKRLQKEVDKAKEFGVEKLVKNLFSVTDTINICLQNKPALKENENVDAVIAFEALETTKKQILSVFKDSYGIEEFIPAIGETFDPMAHNALFEVDTLPDHPNATPGSIGLVVKSGWKRSHQLLRAASVGVIKQKEEGTDLLEDDLE